MTRNHYAPPEARVEDPVSNVRLSTAAHASQVFALRFSITAGATIVFCAVVDALLRDHSGERFVVSVANQIVGSVVLGGGTFIWSWIVVRLAASAARTTVSGTRLSVMLFGALFGLLTLAIGFVLAEVKVSGMLTIAVLGTWALTYPIGVTLVFAHKKPTNTSLERTSEE